MLIFNVRTNLEANVYFEGQNLGKSYSESLWKRNYAPGPYTVIRSF